jgi:hypothetical protein
LRRFLEQTERLLQVDDVDAVAFAENVLLHLGIPALRLVSEVDAGLQEFLHCNRRQKNLLNVIVTPDAAAAIRLGTSQKRRRQGGDP